MALRAIAAAAAGACVSAQSWAVLWEDDFDGAAGQKPASASWNVANNPGLSGNKELEYYAPSAVFLDGASHLVLESTPTVTEGFNFTSG